jgi:hypothetical protein
MGSDGMGWIDLTQDGDQWRAVSNTVLYVGFHKMLAEFSVGAQLANKQTKKKTPWLLVRERSIPTDRPPLVDEI